ncbi:hypothetical protein Tco_0974887 [Tanacetum coccineum]|uniref:Uncharacterized protein n=1 Tax=Tanacetum coccineum TaxID=301880 RepID=A0ABQ5ECT7_9ASTR
MEMQRLQKKASIMKDSFLNSLSALKSKFMLLSKKDVPGINASEFDCAFSHIFGEDVHTFTITFSQNMATLETQLTNETLHESNCKAAFIVLKTPFEKIFTSMLIKSSQLDAIEKRMNAKRLQKQGDVDMDNALDASPVLTKSSRIYSGKKNDCNKTGNDQISKIDFGKKE